MAKRWGKNGNSERLFFWAPRSLQMVIAAMKLKDIYSLEESYDQPRQHIKKQRHYIVNKGSSTQSCGFSSSQVWMWELDYNVLVSFNGPEPGGPESTIRKWKRERGWYSLVYAENQQSPWHRACIAHNQATPREGEDTGRLLERVLEAPAGEWAHRVSTLQRISRRGLGGRERENKKDTGT